LLHPFRNAGFPALPTSRTAQGAATSLTRFAVGAVSVPGRATAEADMATLKAITATTIAADGLE
jgi:hypothetical protein